jgi:hypothetical protein
VIKLLAAAAIALASGGGDAFAAVANQNAQTLQHVSRIGHLGGVHGRRRWSRGMEVHGFNYQVISPRDASSGQATGKRQHKPFP